MWKLRRSFCLISLLLLCFLVALAAAKGSRTGRTKWPTLTGSRPLVIARGGFSGIFPDSSSLAYQLALQTGLSDLHVWCDVQLTKDGIGICFPDIRLQNASSIDIVYPRKEKTYNVNGESLSGYFSVDFTFEELLPVNLKQRIYSRAPNFDGTTMPIVRVDDVVGLNPSGLWLSIPHDAFFTQHKLNMQSFVVSVSRGVDSVVNYISSPEVGFLKSLASQFRRGSPKLIFQFLEPNKIEPSTNQSYGSLRNNLTFIGTFAAGILVPKTYIRPVDDKLYLSEPTSLTLDAHKSNLEVYASDFANDAILPYDYSYDPVLEYLSFIDNGNFSVDGVLSDFPLTPSAAIDCFSHMGKNDTVQADILIISSEGASGDYPGCTDMAYDKAVKDGADIIDCPVQVTKDGIPFCLGSINLRDKTNAQEMGWKPTTNPDHKKDGIFTYDLRWSEIEKLRPAISNPYNEYSLFRNPKARNMGNLMQLSKFLSFANNASSVSGILISIENAAYLAEKQGLYVTDIVLDALNKSDYNNQTAKRIMIKSSESAVLKKIKSSSNYELVYLVDGDVRDILNTTILDIKEFARSVVVSKKSVLPFSSSFLTSETAIVSKLQQFNLSVYVQLFRNEFVAQPWDFFSDAYLEINTYVYHMEIDGVITEFPSTAAKFKRNRCLGYKVPPGYMTPVQPGGLISIMDKSFLPPTQAPSPILAEDDVVEAPLPLVQLTPTTPTTANGSTALGPTTPPNGQPTLSSSTSTLFSIICIICSAVL